MRINEDDVEILNATSDHATDWSKTFLTAMNSCRWMSRFIKDQNISELDVSISFSQDIRKELKTDRFLIAYYAKKPVGILRMDEYWVPKAVRIISHFPLVIPKFQRKGIGKLLVKTGVQQAQSEGFVDVWSECWSKDMREIKLYRTFYEKIGFTKKSNRLEMICFTKAFNEDHITEIKGLKISKSDEITDELVQAISQSYAKSKDKLHVIENLNNPKITESFLKKTRQSFLEIGFKIDCVVVKYNKKLCAGLLTATSKNRGMILEIGVIPEFRKLKIAQYLVELYLYTMKSQQINEVVLGVDEENIPAINLYEKLGFSKSWNGMLMLLEDKNKIGL